MPFQHRYILFIHTPFWEPKTKTKTQTKQKHSHSRKLSRKYTQEPEHHGWRLLIRSLIPCKHSIRILEALYQGEREEDFEQFAVFSLTSWPQKRPSDYTGMPDLCPSCSCCHSERHFRRSEGKGGADGGIHGRGKVITNFRKKNPQCQRFRYVRPGFATTYKHGFANL